MRAAAFIDMDGTLLRGESQFAFLIWCWRRRIAPSFHSLRVATEYASYLLGLSRNAIHLRTSGFALLAGVSVERLEKTSAKFFKTVLVRRFRLQAAAMVAAHRERRHVTVLVTSASELIARPILAQFDFDALIATRLLTHDGCYTGIREFPEPYGEGKRQLVERFCIQHSISVRDSFAYADHHTDTPLLEFVGHPVAVNPTRELRRITEKRKWRVMDWDAPAFQDTASVGPIHSC